jgi:hypothetical protein
MSTIDGMHEFDTPELFCGTEVEVCLDPAFTYADWGVIVTPRRKSADIWFMGTGGGVVRRGLLEDCWYENDPRIKTNPGIINSEERRGVFRLSKREVMIRAAEQKINLLEETVEKLLKRITGLERALQARS